MDEPTTEDLVYCGVHGWSKPTRHHKYPRSRGGGDIYFSWHRSLHQKLRLMLGLSPLKGDRSNINERTCATCHPKSHDLYANKIPTETITHNVENLWDGEKRWVYLWVWQDITDQIRKLLHLPPRQRESGVTLQLIQTDRLRRTLEEEVLIRKIVYELGLEFLKGVLQIQKRMHQLGLREGDLCRIEEATQDIIRFARMNGNKNRKQLLEELIDDKELGLTESIRPVIWSWKMRRPH